jgi:hypothetical protein
VTLVEQWRSLEGGLDPNWSEARVRLEAEGRADRAAALLGPLNPGRRGDELVFVVGRTGAAPGPEAVRRLLRKLDGERIAGRLELVDLSRMEVPAQAVQTTLAQAWDGALAPLPSDWTDIWAEVELSSSDYLERAALRTAPLNPRAGGDRATLRFRCASHFGYGASPGMVRRCLERCDDDGIRGGVRVLRALSDTIPVQTQGPVWYVGGDVV